MTDEQIRKLCASLDNVAITIISSGVLVWVGLMFNGCINGCIK